MTNKQQSLDLQPKKTGPVECLGLTFENDGARRVYFTERLKEKLRDPEFREMPGFPKGTDEDILQMSDPPYYTACPNPFLEDYIREYGQPYDPNDGYHREPLAVDVSVGKTDALYKAHPYHTKVPTGAIVPAILHYTQPGDVILDGFCGSGMTGVAVRLTASPKDGRAQVGTYGNRFVILNDLSPYATFMAANYVLPFDADGFDKGCDQVLDELEKRVGWAYRTRHPGTSTYGRINFTVWSEVLGCPNCAHEIVFLEEALDEGTNKTKQSFPCPNCGKTLTKRSLERLFETVTDNQTHGTYRRPKRKPILINYSIGDSTFEKEPDSEDLQIIHRLESSFPPQGFPTDRMMHAAAEVTKWGDEWRAGAASFTNVHHLFLPRAAHALQSVYELVRQEKNWRLRHMLEFWVEQAVWSLSVMNRYRPTGYSQVGQYMSGRIRIFAQHAECSPWYVLGGKANRLSKAFSSVNAPSHNAWVSTGSCSGLPLPANSVDYVYTDPPFGSNFAYSELNFITESFYQVFSRQEPEAIVSKHQRKDIPDYQKLMTECFQEYHRVLKPGRWISVVFSNSSNSVWYAVQEAMSSAGFVIADVRSLDKQQGTYNQVAGVSVDQDLIISAYKPSTKLGQSLLADSGTEQTIWQFLREHMSNLPVFLGNDESAEVIRERLPQMLLDRTIGFHVRNGIPLALTTSEILQGMTTRFALRDGMYYLHDQAAEYERRRAKIRSLRQLSFIVKDEESAVRWLAARLGEKPQSFQDLQPVFHMELTNWNVHEKPVELKEVLQENFLHYDGSGPVPAQIHTYLSTNFKDMRGLSKDDPRLKAKAADRWYVPDPNKQSDLDQLRNKRLLKEFLEYKGSKEKKLKQFRMEAVRAGFKMAYDQKDYRTIVDVAKKLPEEVIQEDEKLLMYYDVASMRLGED